MGMGRNGKQPVWEWEWPLFPWESIPIGGYSVKLSTVYCKLAMLIGYQAKRPRLGDFSDLCDPEDIGQQRNELSEQAYVNMKIAKDVDMVEFWKENRALLPQLFKVARRVLCVPASSSASERVFSTGGRLLEKQRTNLTPDSTDSLLFLHSNMETSASDDNFD